MKLRTRRRLYLREAFVMFIFARIAVRVIAPARAGTTVTGERSALHRGRTTMVWQTHVRSAEGKLCAVVTQTQLVLDT